MYFFHNDIWCVRISLGVMDKVDEYLSTVYYHQKRFGSFEGAEVLYRDVKKEEKYKLTRKQILDWLMRQDEYTLHNSFRRSFTRNRVYVARID